MRPTALLHSLRELPLRPVVILALAECLLPLAAYFTISYGFEVLDENIWSLKEERLTEKTNLFLLICSLASMLSYFLRYNALKKYILELSNKWIASATIVAQTLGWIFLMQILKSVSCCPISESNISAFAMLYLSTEIHLLLIISVVLLVGLGAFIATRFFVFFSSFASKAIIPILTKASVFARVTQSAFVLAALSVLIPYAEWPLMPALILSLALGGLAYAVLTVAFIHQTFKPSSASR